MTDKTKGITRINDITADWVKTNFDIDKERNSITQQLTSTRADYIANLDSGLDSGLSIDALLTEVNKWFDEQTEEFDLPRDARRMIRRGEDSDYYSCDSSVTHYLEVYLEADIPETDAQVITRIKKREQAKVRRRNEKAKKAKAEEKKILDEKKLLKDLMKKYKDEL